MNSRSERGVALVITLVMLAVVTFMAITFLAVSRRERTAVGVSDEQAAAQRMTETAVARAEAELLSRMMARGTLLAGDLMVSTNFIERHGFNITQRPSGYNFTNVNYDYRQDARPLSLGQRLANMTNLWQDPRPPVYVWTTINSNNVLSTNFEFRFYLDLNRNGRFDTNGLWPEVSPRGRYYTTNGFEGGPLRFGVWRSNFFVGDPEWIGVLQHPDQPHSPSNRFVGRFAYLVQPAGKSLDLNFIHNNARQRTDRPTLDTLAYYRNQGFGSWELNLAAFLRDLNTNAWRRYAYTGLNQAPNTVAGADALTFLRYRYGGDYEKNLAPATRWFGNRPATAFQRDFIDAYCDGPPFSGYKALTEDDDRPGRPWAGSDNPQAYFEYQDLFDPTKLPTTPAIVTGVSLSARLRDVGTRRATYDRYTFYRWLGQMGFDSTPATREKIHLNYANVPPYDPTNMVEWPPIVFFTNLVERLFVACRTTNLTRDARGNWVTNYAIGDTLVRSNFSSTNIWLYPRNEYTSTIHRLLQVAVNIYDATTNRAVSGYPYVPTVFRPTFGVDGTNVLITGFLEVTNTDFLRADMPPLDLHDPQQRALLATRRSAVVYDVPFLIGAKKGFPNFNEFALENIAQLSRRIELRKRTDTEAAPSLTNLMYLLTISNQFGLEAWNSYATNYPRTLRVQTAGDFHQTLTTSNNSAAMLPLVLRATNVHYVTNYAIAARSWLPSQFRLPIFRSVMFVPDSVYRPLPRPTFVPTSTNELFRQNLGFYVPDWALQVTNQFYFAMVDEGLTPPRLVDFACFGRMTAVVNISLELAGQPQLPGQGGTPAEPGNCWLTNRARGLPSLQAPTAGMINQMDISLGNIPISEQQWASYSRTPPDGMDKPKAIDRLRMFVGLSPLVYTSELDRRQLQADLRGKPAFQAGYTPIRKLYQEVSWQVNDPLVHYIVEDLLDPNSRPDDPTRTNSVRFAMPPQIQVTNENLGLLNDRYRPWGGNPNQSTDPLATDLRYKDPLVTASDDWEFPTNKLPNIGWIGRVHRGTPWQTIYLKSAIADTNAWFRWAGSYATHPTNDWKFVQLFTVAPNPNAARGLLSVNQTNLAAWSAVLGGVSVLTNLTPLAGVRTNTAGRYAESFIEPDAEPRAGQLRRIVEGINRTRSFEPLGLFEQMGRILATPELTVASPYISTNNLVNDFVLERIPQQVLSLLKEDEPRFVIYAFGQTLREAPNSLYLGAGAFNKLCTNYQVRAESATRTVLRLEGSILNPRAVVENFTQVQTE